MSNTADQNRIAALESELACMIRVVKMVKGMEDFKVDHAKPFRKGSKNLRNQNVQESLDLYARSAEGVLGRTVGL